jgi:cyclophilin family peptidyl-prolyl cis-trans isomerase
MRTARGRIVITFDGVQAPLTVLNFATLADRRAYDNLRFHRVVPGFVAQDGDPRGDGEGGPGYAIRDELTLLPYSRGAVGMALSGPDTGGSQYFLTLTPQPHLTGHYTVFGAVTAGLGTMDELVEGDSIDSIRVHW